MEIRMPFETLLSHDHWANGQALASVEAVKGGAKKALGLLGHLLGAEACWIQRLSQEGGTGETEVQWLDRMAAKGGYDWPEPAEDVSAVRRVWKEDLPAFWSDFLADARRADPARTCSYVNWRGETYRCKVEHALIQLMLHSAYHRGQVATAVRAAGGEPAVVDFIQAVRSGVLA